MGLTLKKKKEKKKKKKRYVDIFYFKNWTPKFPLWLSG